MRISVSVSCAPRLPVCLPECVCASCATLRVLPSKSVRLSRPISRMFIAPTDELSPIDALPSICFVRPTTLCAYPATTITISAARQAAAYPTLARTAGTTPDPGTHAPLRPRPRVSTPTITTWRRLYSRGAINPSRRHTRRPGRLCRRRTCSAGLRGARRQVNARRARSRGCAGTGAERPVRLRQVPHLVGGVCAGPDLQLGAGAPVAGVVEALTRLRVVELSVGLRFEDLRTRAIAGVEVYRRSVGGAASVDVQTLAERLQGAAGLNHRPLL